MYFHDDYSDEDLLDDYILNDPEIKYGWLNLSINRSIIMSRYISKNELIEKRSWDEKLILLYLTPESSFIGEISFAYQNVIKIENYLTNVAKIDFKAKNEKTIL